MSKGDGLGDRMKNFYENISRHSLYRKIPVIMRLDGKAFHSFTHGCNKPFDDKIIKTMQDTTEFLMRNIQGAKVAYVQSDEINILITDYDDILTCGWFDYNIQKMCSVAASMAGVQFTLEYNSNETLSTIPGFESAIKPAYFDARVFNIPKEDVTNCFRWRYQDWKRNSMSMLAQSLYSQKELNGKNWTDQGSMCCAKGKSWIELEPVYMHGTTFYWDSCGPEDKRCLIKDFVNLNSNNDCEPIFKEYI